VVVFAEQDTLASQHTGKLYSE